MVPAKLIVKGLPSYSDLYTQATFLPSIFPLICTVPRVVTQLPVKSFSFWVRVHVWSLSFPAMLRCTCHFPDKEGVSAACARTAASRNDRESDFIGAFKAYTHR